MEHSYKLEENPREEFIMGLLKESNNIVVTTKCNINCCFCSRKFNPFKTETYHRNFNEIISEIKLCLPNRMKKINSSISRITDGEPFTHPRIWDILEVMRKEFPYKGLARLHDKIQITTNGTYLTKENLKKLEELGGIIIVHSINSTDVDDWMKLSGSSKKLAEIVTNVPKLIKNFEIAYLPSIVAMPQVVGYNGIEKSIRELSEHNVRSIRVFLPTYTKYASKEEQKILYCDENKLKELIDRLRKETKTNIWLYPEIHSDLKPKLYGLENVGILPSDEILAINNKKMFSRTHAFDTFLYAKDIQKVVIKTKEGKIKQINLNPKDIKIKNYVDFIVNEDINFTPEIIEKAVKKSQRILVMHSEAGEFIVKEAFKKAIRWSNLLKTKKFYFKTVYNDFYCGNVKCSGLLMCTDYKKYLEEFIENNFKPDLVLITQDSFDILGRDLLKDSIYDVFSEVGIEFVIMKNR